MKRAALIALLALGACDREEPAPRAPGPAPAATRPSAYRVNRDVPTGTIVVRARARAPVERRATSIPSDYRTRNPADAAVCEACASKGSLPDETLLVDAATLGIANVAASLKQVAEGPLPPLSPATLDNSCCRFQPHVSFVPVGSPLSIRNSDPISHAVVIATLSGVQLYMATIPAGGKAETTTIDATGILGVTCPIHSWMRAWIVAARHPYVAVTGERGEARLEQVPAGAHDLVLWHESLGTAARAVTVAAGAVAEVALTDGDFARR